MIMSGMKQLVTVLNVKRFIGEIDGNAIKSLKADIYSREPFGEEETRIGYPVTSMKVTNMSVYDKFASTSFPCECEATLTIKGDKVVLADLSPVQELSFKPVDAKAKAK